MKWGVGKLGQWLAATAVGYGLGWALSGQIWTGADFLGGALGMALGSACLGTLQWLVLRRLLPVSGRWVWAAALVGLVSTAVQVGVFVLLALLTGSTDSGLGLFGLLIGGALGALSGGLVVGLVQRSALQAAFFRARFGTRPWSDLGRQADRTSGWVGASIAGWALGWAAGLVVGAWANEYDFLMGIVFGIGIGVAGGIANGIVLGAITSSTLLWLLRQPGAVEP
jgi:hypothetical protein